MCCHNMKLGNTLDGQLKVYLSETGEEMIRLCLAVFIVIKVEQNRRRDQLMQYL